LKENMTNKWGVRSTTQLHRWCDSYMLASNTVDHGFQAAGGSSQRL